MAQALSYVDDIQTLFCQAPDTQTQLVKSVVIRAKELSIAHGSDPRYWKWITIPYIGVLAAELIEVCWLEIDGKYPEGKLTQGKEYEVNFAVELKDNLVVNGPVKLTLDATGEEHQEHEIDLKNMPRNQIIGLKVGQFTAKTLCGSDNMVKFSLKGHDGTTWKKGLVVIGASISLVKPLK